MTTTTQDGFAAWQKANGEIVTEYIDGREVIPLEALAFHQHTDDPAPFECVRCGDSVHREDAAQGPDGVLCPSCVDHELRFGGRVSFG